MHSAASRTVPGAGEETILLYQSGVEFVGLTPEKLLALRKLLADVGGGSPPS